jgi:hypothetical protein
MPYKTLTKDTKKEDKCNGSIVVSTRTHGKAARRSDVDAVNGRTTESGGHPDVADGNADGKEVSDPQKVSLLAEKQSQLQEVLDTHDTLVCHSFVEKRSTITIYRYEKSFIWRTFV